MTKAVIIGAGTYGAVYAAYLADDYEIAGYIDDDPKKFGCSVEGISVLGSGELLPLLKEQGIEAAFVPIGNNKIRGAYLEKLRAMGYYTPSFIHPQTIIHPSVKFNGTVYILPGTNIMPYTTLGDKVMISMGVNIAHHCQIDEGVFLSQGVNVGASILIESLVFIGIGATIMTGVKRLGKSSFIGGGAVVIKDVDPNLVLVGNPARVLKRVD